MSRTYKWLEPIHATVWVIVNRSRHRAHYEGIPYCWVPTQEEFPKP